MTTGWRRAGFTLLELLVGIAVLGFVLLALSQGSQFGLRATQTQARLSEGRGDLDAVDRALRRLIEETEPGDDHSGPTLAGDRGRLSLVSTLPEGAQGGLGRIADIAIGVDARRRLLLRWTPHLHARRFGPPPTPAEVVLLAGVQGIEFSYWGTSWVAAWTQPALPALIRMRLIFPPGDVRRWPDLVVAPMRRRPG